MRWGVVSSDSTRQTLTPPPGEVRRELVRARAEVQFRLEDDDPPAGPPLPNLKGAVRMPPRFNATFAWGRAGRGLRCSSPSRISATISSGAAWKAASTDGAFRSVDSDSGGRRVTMREDFRMSLALCNAGAGEWRVRNRF